MQFILICVVSVWVSWCIVFLFNDTATSELYTYLHTLSLHDALPICDLRHLDHDDQEDTEPQHVDAGLTDHRLDHRHGEHHGRYAVEEATEHDIEHRERRDQRQRRELEAGNPGRSVARQPRDTHRARQEVGPGQAERDHEGSAKGHHTARP